MELIPLDANTVVSTVGVVIALAALGLTVHQARLTRAHNRLSVRPVLDFGESFPAGRRAGLRLRNVGLGPAEIISGVIWLDGRKRDEPFGRLVIDALRGELSAAQRRPSAATFTPGAVLAKDYDAFLLSVDPFDRAKDNEFVELIGRLRIVITYASLYGDKAVLDWPSQR
jgi:hypothetical protein